MVCDASMRRRYVPRSRWAAWEQAVLAKVSNPEACLCVVRQRQEDADDDKNEAEEVADHFRRELERRGHDPNSQCIFIPSQIAAWWLGAATNMRWATNKASAHLKTLGIRELSKTKSSGRLGWRWAGTAVPRTGEQITSMMPLRDLPEEDRSSQGTAERH